MILAEITVDTVEYYLSTDGYQAEKFYFPFIVSMPRLSIGPVGKGGLIGVQLGDIVLTKDPHNTNHPFGGGRFGSMLNNPTQYACKIIWSETQEVLHDAAISLIALDEQSLTFTLADRAFEETLKRYSITNKWNYVEEVKNTTPVTVDVPGHEYVVGQRVVFSNMTGAGIELNYDGDLDNYYIVASVSGDDVGLKDSENVDVDPSGVTIGTVTYDGGLSDNIPKNRIGIPAFVPFTHGDVFHKTPVIRRSEKEVANPNMEYGNLSFPLEVYEDGVLVGSTDPNSSEYFNRLPTDTVIYLNSALAEGDLSISGRSRNGSTLTELFNYFATQLNLGFNSNKA
jgi:hypothetical protein